MSSCVNVALVCVLGPVCQALGCCWLPGGQFLSAGATGLPGKGPASALIHPGDKPHAAPWSLWETVPLCPGMSYRGFSKGSSRPLPVYRGVCWGGGCASFRKPADFLKIIRNHLFRLSFFCVYILKERLEYRKAPQLEGPFPFIQCTIFLCFRLALRNAAC